MYSMTSFQCTQCKVCQRRKTIWEAFNHSNTCCDDCFTPPEEKVKKERQTPRWGDKTRMRYNWKNPKAKEIYKQSLISNS